MEVKGLAAVIRRLVRWYHEHYDEKPSTTIETLVHMSVRLSYNQVLRDQIEQRTNPATGHLQVEGFYVEAAELYWTLKLDDGLLVGARPTDQHDEAIRPGHRPVQRGRRRRDDRAGPAPDRE